MATTPPYHVGVLAYDGCLGTEIFGIADLLLFANRIAAAVCGAHDDLFQVTVAARNASEVVTAPESRMQQVEAPCGKPTSKISGASEARRGMAP
jgi:hypothetical protein